jgi:hypothetical protein
VSTESRTRAQTASSLTYDEVKEKAADVVKLYADNNVNLPGECGLSLQISDVEKVAGLWSSGREGEITQGQLFQAAQFNRIADALATLAGVNYRAKYLRYLTSGSLSPFDRVQSKAKDLLWEME